MTITQWVTLTGHTNKGMGSIPLALSGWSLHVSSLCLGSSWIFSTVQKTDVQMKWRLNVGVPCDRLDERICRACMKWRQVDYLERRYCGIYFRWLGSLSLGQIWWHFQSVVYFLPTRPDSRNQLHCAAGLCSQRNKCDLLMTIKPSTITVQGYHFSTGRKDQQYTASLSYQDNMAERHFAMQERSC